MILELTRAQYREYVAWLSFIRGLQAICLDHECYEYRLVRGPSIMIVD